MTTYIVTTPNPDYSETAFGIQFNKGRAVVDEETLDPNLGYTLEQVIHGLEKDLGYSVRRIGSSAQELLEKIDPVILAEAALKTGLVSAKTRKKARTPE